MLANDVWCGKWVQRIEVCVGGVLMKSGKNMWRQGVCLLFSEYIIERKASCFFLPLKILRCYSVWSRSVNEKLYYYCFLSFLCKKNERICVFAIVWVEWWEKKSSCRYVVLCVFPGGLVFSPPTYIYIYIVHLLIYYH